MSWAAVRHSSTCAEFDMRAAGAALDSPGAEFGDTACTDVRLFGPLDLVSAPGLRATLDRLRHDGFQHIVLDLAGLDFVGAIGLGVFVDADQALRAVGGTLQLINPSRAMLGCCPSPSGMLC